MRRTEPESLEAASAAIGEPGLASRAGRALGAALRRRCPLDRFGVDGRLLDWTDNLVDGITPEELRDNGGPEAQLGWRAVDSSSMLALNSFYCWRRAPDRLPIAGATGFEVLRFDARCPTGVRGTPPHLDLLALRGDRVVAVTAHCTNFLGRKRARLAPAYDRLAAMPGLEPWHGELRRLRDDPGRYRLVDAAALVKHALGLGRTFPDRPIALAYVFWEPIDADGFTTFARHRAELARLAADTRGGAVTLHPQSFAELWCEWASLGEPSWLPALIAGLRARYAVAIGTPPA